MGNYCDQHQQGDNPPSYQFHVGTAPVSKSPNHFLLDGDMKEEAEGFVKEYEERTLEKVAEGYLKELICRSLVQVVSTGIDGRVKSCRVHDLVHEMIL
ncbi:hypothetical protein MTR_3g084010 [Medicago truncatula]|uniref:Disease resistance protein winged helix domain-containing protein n=1 Tax=Medicago truncatula TaxID=3880 RepID=G7JA77_MEDTR|nr:hypothetical protein MTR_3g084010 [Medicago truncatula]